VLWRLAIADLLTNIDLEAKSSGLSFRLHHLFLNLRIFSVKILVLRRRAVGLR
jgi:hypothetical protein